MGNRSPHESYIIIHQCVSGFMIEYPDPGNDRKLIRQVVSGEDEEQSALNLITEIISLLGFKKDQQDSLEIGFKIKK